MSAKSKPDKSPRPIIGLMVGGYLILKNKPGKFFIYNPIGEAMETTEARLEKAIQQFFNREF